VPSKRELAERVRSEAELRKQDERWERDRRREDREDRKIKDEELNGVRLQLRDQAAGFATKDMLFAMERAIDARSDALEKSWDMKLATAIDRLNTEGTEGYREDTAERLGRETATKEILAGVRTTNENSATNRRWLIGISVTIILFAVAQMITIVLFVTHLLTGV
jgi:hypothetical protein